MARLYLALVASAIILALLPAGFADMAEENKKSTKTIMTKVCLYPGVRNDEVAQGFMACYDEAPGKEIFLGCMEEAFGKLFDTKWNFRRNCAQVWNVPKYAKCLTREFEAADLDKEEAVYKVNACQLPVVS